MKKIHFNFNIKKKQLPLILGFIFLLFAGLVIFSLKIQENSETLGAKPIEREVIEITAPEFPKLSEGEEKPYFNKKFSQNGDWIVVSIRGYKGVWFPDNHENHDKKLVTVEIQAINKVNNKAISIKGDALLPRSYTGSFNFTSDSNSLIEGNFELSNLRFSENFDYIDEEVERNFRVIEEKERILEEETITLLPTREFYDFEEIDDLNSFKSTFFGNSNFFLDPDITSCGTISSPGIHTVTQNLTSTGTCITISADDVFLDGNGYNMSGDDSGLDYGVTDSGTRTNLTIKNFKNIIDFGRGIYFAGTSNSAVTNLTITGSDFQAIYTESSTNNNYTNLTITNSANGIQLWTGSTNNLIYNVNSTGATSTGNFILAASNNTLQNSFSSDSSSAGISFGGSLPVHYNTVINFTSTGDSIGIRLPDDAGENNSIINVKIIGSSTSIQDPDGGPNKNNYLIYNNSFGEIRWINDSQFFLNNMDLTGDIGLGINLSIGNNTAYLNKDAFTGNINSSANITLYNIGDRGFTIPTILKNGINCGDECFNFTALNASTVKFNVTYAGANYAIGEFSTGISSCQTINSPGFYHLTQNITATGTCITISANNTVFNGNGFKIEYGTSGSGRGIDVSITFVNVTIKNTIIEKGGNISNANYGIRLRGNSNLTIFNNQITTNGTSSNDGIRIISGSTDINISSNTISTDGNSTGNHGINMLAGSNTIEYNIIETHGSISFGVRSTNDDTLIFSNTISTNGTDSRGISLIGAARNVVISNNITTIGTNSNGVSIHNIASSDNNVTSNIFYSINGADLNFATSGINGTWVIDQEIGNYTLNDNLINFKDTTFGQIVFTETITGTGSNLSAEISIGNNSAVVNDSNSNLNSAANITLFGIGEKGFTIPGILRDGSACNEGTSPSCFNFTALNATNVEFNVSSWSEYSIGETGTCSCPASGNWVISDGSACLLESSCVITPNSLRIFNGSLYISSTGLLHAQGCYVQDSYNLFVEDNGGLLCS